MSANASTPSSPAATGYTVNTGKTPRTPLTERTNTLLAGATIDDEDASNDAGKPGVADASEEQRGVADCDDADEPETQTQSDNDCTAPDVADDDSESDGGAAVDPIFAHLTPDELEELTNDAYDALAVDARWVLAQSMNFGDAYTAQMLHDKMAELLRDQYEYEGDEVQPEAFYFRFADGSSALKLVDDENFTVRDWLELYRKAQLVAHWPEHI